MKLRNNKGSISLYVLVACAFFVTILMAQYSRTLNKYKACPRSDSNPHCRSRWRP